MTSSIDRSKKEHKRFKFEKFITEFMLTNLVIFINFFCDKRVTNLRNSLGKFVLDQLSYSYEFLFVIISKRVHLISEFWILKAYRLI